MISQALCASGIHVVVRRRSTARGSPWPFVVLSYNKAFDTKHFIRINLRFIDDGLVGGDIDVLISEFQTVRQQAAELELIYCQRSEV